MNRILRLKGSKRNEMWFLYDYDTDTETLLTNEQAGVLLRNHHTDTLEAVERIHRVMKRFEEFVPPLTEDEKQNVQTWLEAGLSIEEVLTVLIQRRVNQHYKENNNE